MPAAGNAAHSFQVLALPHLLWGRKLRQRYSRVPKSGITREFQYDFSDLCLPCGNIFEYLVRQRREADNMMIRTPLYH
jgi:hypothetical protein